VEQKATVDENIVLYKICT